MSFQQILNKINPKKFFLIDSIGALLSAFLLGVVLTRFEDTFGMPQKVLYWLSFMACVFSAYSFFCYIGIKGNWKPYLKIISVVNLLYCCLTMTLVIYFFQKLTVPGMLYFILEIIVVTILALIELKMASSPDGLSLET